MWLLALLLWAPAGAQVADRTKAAITLKPPWVILFQEENVTLTCEGPHLPVQSATQWFLNGTALQTLTPTYTIAAASVDDSGEYRCQTSHSERSDPVQLEVHRGLHFPDWLLLQVQSKVLAEGDPLTLRCHGWKNKLVYNMIFYRNDEAFKFSAQNSEFTIPKTNLSHSGVYHCSGVGRQQFTSPGVSVTVQELFPAPVLKAAGSAPLREGHLVNLSCDTELLLQRPGSQLYFSFYVGGRALTRRNASSGYQIPAAKREDSGLYWCEAATADGGVVKRSPELELQVLGLQSPTPVWCHVLFYLAVGTIFLVDTIFCIIIHKELQKQERRDLEISLGSDPKQRVTSHLQKDRYL